MLNKIQDIIKSGQKVLVRCDRAGVFFGTLADYDNGTAEIRLTRAPESGTHNTRWYKCSQ